MSEEAKEIALTIAQECISKFPVIVLGSGASAAHGIPGMPALKERLLKVVHPSSSTSEYIEKWKEFLAKLRDTDLEVALDTVRLPEALTNHVVEKTWDFLAPYDYQVFEQAIKERDIFPLTRLLRHLFNSTRNEVHVVTPNYDRLAEYAADSGNLTHYTGFNYGHIRERAVRRPRVHVGSLPTRIVNIWKVHGSLDWFQNSDGIVIGLPISKVRPSGVSPVIVTPGVEKYRLTHDEPFHSIKTEADKALREADAYLCVGYGFNDKHLQTTLAERYRERDVPLIVLTKRLSATARQFLNTGKSGQYLAIEESSSGCRVYSKEFPDGEEIAGESIWQLEQFLEVIIS